MIAKSLALCLLITAVCCDYQPSISQKLAQSCAIAYSAPADIEKWNCTFCKFPMKNPKTFHGKALDIFGFVGYQPDFNAIIVAFRGTIDYQNWIADLDFQEVEYPGCKNCKVHEGFYDAYLTVGGYVRKAVQDLSAQFRGAEIYVTGFSLGGALATVCALDMKDVFGKVHQFYTFGQPRVGNEAFALNFYESFDEHYRVIHYADIVPHVPPQVPVPYTHFAYEVWYDEAMKNYKICGAEEYGCSKSIPPNKWTNSDHNIGAYMRMPTTYTNLQAEQ